MYINKRNSTYETLAILETYILIFLQYKRRYWSAYEYKTYTDTYFYCKHPQPTFEMAEDARIALIIYFAVSSF